MPELITTGLWNVQVEAIRNLELSLAGNHPRAVIQMATGSGKTFTAVTTSYRLIKFGKVKRILFLVDRNNLGRQTNNEFQQYVSPYNNRKFTEEYTVQHLRRNTIDPAAKVCITTIQRLYSILKGEEEFPEENEEGGLFETAPSLFKEPLPVVYNPLMPIETFDIIIVDECHRSIYNVWRQVLEYFDAFIIGLTATPTAQTIGFFGGNLVQDYSHERAVVDGVNVGYDVYRIETKITKDGAKLAKEPGVFVPRRDRRTRKKKFKELDNDLIYEANDLDRDVVAMDQIRLVIRTFKERLFTEIFPGRTEVPKTLVFAKTDLHADDIVKVIREEFGRGNDFCQKITSQDDRQEARGPAQRVPQLVQSPDRRHGRHDRHRHRRQAAGMPDLHAEHQFGLVLRADEGPRLPGHQARRSARRDARRQAEDAFRDRRCRGRLRTRQDARRRWWIASLPCRWTRFSTPWPPEPSAMKSARRWRPG